MAEGAEHLAYKRIAIDLLKDRGFSGTEIKEEYDFEIKENGRTKYIIDVVGISQGRKVAVECGETTLSKLMELRKHFDEVLVVNPESVIKMYENWRAQFLSLLRENDDLKGQLEDIRKNAQDRYGRQEESLREQLDEKEKEARRANMRLKEYQRVIAESCQAMKEGQS